MSKKALGRGLGQLLAGHPTTGPQSPLSGAPSNGGPVLGPGLRVLAGQRNGTTPKRNGHESVGQKSAEVALKLSLLTADALLVIMTLLWRGLARPQLTGWQVFGCIAGIGFAAWLGCLAAWLTFKRK